MKSRFPNRQSLSAPLQDPVPLIAKPHPSSLRNTDGFWKLNFLGATAVLPQDHALFYVASLLISPPPAPVPALTLASLVLGLYSQHPDYPYRMDTIPTQPQQAQRSAILVYHINALENIAADPDEPTPVRHETHHLLLYLHRTLRDPQPPEIQTSQSSGENILAGLIYLYNTLATATGRQGNPTQVERAFAIHLLATIIIPSIQYTLQLGSPHFIYQPPPGITWER